MRNSAPVWEKVEDRKAEFIALADRVFDAPELLYAEHRAVAEHAAALEAQGFRVTRDVAGIPTAVTGEAGEGGPVIAILGEYDALPGLSQAAGRRRAPARSRRAARGMAAATTCWARRRCWRRPPSRTGWPRRGCPAACAITAARPRRAGAAKTYMVRDGLFDDVDIAISWHPASWTGVDDARSLANTRIDFTFTGRAAHAAGAPELGRSALDACELMSVGVNYMREHMPDDARVHYAYLDAGGPAPNVVQAHATVRHLIRARDNAGLAQLVERVRKIAEGAALMTETSVEARTFSAVSNLVGNRPLEEAMQSALERLGPVAFDAADRDFARAIRATLTPADIEATFRRIGRPTDPDLALCDFVAPLERPRMGGEGSTDLGDVSWAVPTVQARVATCAIGTPFHTWQTTAQGKVPAAHKGMVHAAKVMADDGGGGDRRWRAARGGQGRARPTHGGGALSLSRCRPRSGRPSPRAEAPPAEAPDILAGMRACSAGLPGGRKWASGRTER